jgi:uncharacterized membrane protein
MRIIRLILGGIAAFITATVLGVIGWNRMKEKRRAKAEADLSDAIIRGKEAQKELEKDHEKATEEMLRDGARDPAGDIVQRWKHEADRNRGS